MIVHALVELHFRAMSLVGGCWYALVAAYVYSLLRATPLDLQARAQGYGGLIQAVTYDLKD